MKICFTGTSEIWQTCCSFEVAETTHSLCIIGEFVEMEAMDDQPLYNELC